MMPFDSILKRTRTHALEIFTRALETVEAGACVKKHLRRLGDRLIVGGKEYDLSAVRNCYVIGAGKASASMAQAVEEILGDRTLDGYIVVKYHHTRNLKQLALIEAGHPLPDENGYAGARKILKIVDNADKDDLVISLFSGGGSALLPLPPYGITLPEKQQTIEALLLCGADIREINTVRKHLSDLKGGRLAKRIYPARHIALMLSDVVGDPLDSIASGPTVPDPSTFQDSLDILTGYHLETRLPASVLKHLHDGASRRIEESPKPGDPEFERTQNLIVGSNRDAILLAKQEAGKRGYHPIVLSSLIQGDTREVSGMHTAILKEVFKTGNPAPPPVCIISGGETTVTVTGKGKGGRNQEFVLHAVPEIAGSDPAVVMSAGTDGTDGPTDAAGALADNRTLQRAREAGLDPDRFIKENNSYHFFKSLGDLIITGPTNTNVMDIRMILVPSHSSSNP
ncbi:MAG: glycerate kinase [Thermodesulfobacteriota bacterium]